MENEYSPEMQAMFAILRNSLFQEPLPDFEESVDWKEVYQEFRNQACIGLTSGCLSKLPVDEELRLVWWRDIAAQFRKFIVIMNQEEELAQLFKENDIHFAVVKGSSSALYYPNPAERCMGDIDVLIKREDFDRAKELVEATGFAINVEEDNPVNNRHIGYKKGTLELELHRYFAATKDENTDKEMNDYLDLEVAKMTVREQDGTRYHTMSDEVNGLILLDHAAHHLRTAIGIRQVIDFVVYADRVCSDEFWNEKLQPLAAKYGLDVLALTLGRIGQMYLGLREDITWCKDGNDELAAKVWKEILRQGNFGRKISADERRVVSAGIGGSRGLRGRLKYEQESGMIHWRAARKCVILRPFAWIYGGGRHAILLMRRKGAAGKLKNELNKAQYQISLLEELKIRR